MAELSALLAEYRRRADDAAAGELTDDATAIRLFAEAEREVCMRGYPLFDATTLSMTRFTIPASTASRVNVTLPEQVLSIDSAAFAPAGTARECSLELVGIDRIEEASVGNTLVTTRPWYAAHSARRTLTLFPGPSQGGTLRLSVYRLPLNDLEDPSDEPEIPLELHDGLVDWVLYRTYSIKDGEQEDPQRASTALRDFTERYGERRDADAMRRHRERRRTTTRPPRF